MMDIITPSLPPLSKLYGMCHSEAVVFKLGSFWESVLNRRNSSLPPLFVFAACF